MNTIKKLFGRKTVKEAVVVKEVKDMNATEKVTKLLSQVRIHKTEIGIKMKDTRTKDPHVNVGEFYVEFLNINTKEEYLEWVKLYKDIVHSKEFKERTLADIMYRADTKDMLDNAPIRLSYHYCSAAFLFYKIREASKIYAESCYQKNKEIAA